MLGGLITILIIVIFITILVCVIVFIFIYIVNICCFCSKHPRLIVVRNCSIEKIKLGTLFVFHGQSNFMKQIDMKHAEATDTAEEIKKPLSFF